MIGPEWDLIRLASGKPASASASRQGKLLLRSRQRSEYVSVREFSVANKGDLHAHPDQHTIRLRHHGR